MKRRIFGAFLASSLLLIMTACSGVTEEEKHPVLAKGDEEDTYPTTTAEYGDVYKNASVSCTYISTEEQEFSFPFDRRKIVQVNVKEGDYVTEGQLLATLDVQDLQEQIEQSQYEIENLEMKKKHTEQLREFDLASAETLYAYTKQLQQDKNELKKKKEKIIKQYKNPLEDIEDAIFLARGRLQQEQEMLKGGRLVAEMSGQVTYCQDALLDSYCFKDAKVIVVSNRDACYFVATDITWAECFTEGVPVEVQYHIPGEVITYEVVPALMEQWDEQMYFKPTGEDIIQMGIGGTITMELDRRENVLCVPMNAVHKSDKGSFVYLVKDGLLEMCYVTVGLEGENLVEITGGLKRGDKIALKR